MQWVPREGWLVLRASEILMEMVTLAEKQQIEARLQVLIDNRVVIARRIAEARALGDLKENGDYHAAREQQGMDEADIRRLQQRLANLSVIDENMSKAMAGTIFIGSMVKMREVGKKNIELIKLVGDSSNEMPDDYDEVTATSPMGTALLKAKVGDVVGVDTPRGRMRFEILEIN